MTYTILEFSMQMLHSWFSSFKDYGYNRSIRQQKDHPKMIISWLLRTNPIRWFYFLFLMFSISVLQEQVIEMMLALGMGSYRGALFHLITHAYSKALLFLRSGSIIHSMEALVGYSPAKSQNMVFMGSLTKHVPITKTFFQWVHSLCGIPPFSYFWSKDEILNDSWLYSPIFAIIACSAA